MEKFIFIFIIQFVQVVSMMGPLHCDRENGIFFNTHGIILFTYLFLKYRNKLTGLYCKFILL